MNRLLYHSAILIACWVLWKKTEFEENLDCPYLVNDTVKVMEGPFSGFSGVIEEVNLEKRKLKVTVKIFGRKTPLELGFMQVEKE